MGAQHIMLRKVDGAEILRRVEQHGVTVMCGAPAVANADPRRRGRRGTARSPAATGCASSCAGAPPPTRTIERIETELGWEFIQIYGLTETTPLLTMNRGRAECDDLSPADRAVKLGRAGAPGPRRADAHQPRRRGARPRQPRDGRLLGAARGHGRRHPAAATTRRPEWFHTGDGGIIDDEGYVTISDRKKDVIISGGENVSSIEVEDACSATRRSPRWPSSACPTRSGASW